jgi:ElaB/YqjD/DUF883 family membrane-anchored ribosome-binding protein
MADEVNVLEKGCEEIREDIAETRTDLADKVETLEQEIKGTVQDATSAVTDTVANVKATVQAVQGAVHDSVAAVGHALDFPAHVRRHPWLLLGGALLAGFLIANLLGRRR